MTLLRRRAALEAWLDHAEALLSGVAEPEGPELEDAVPLERTDAA